MATNVTDSCGEKARNKLWCSFCKTTTHTDKACRRKLIGSVVKHVTSDVDSNSSTLAFKIGDVVDSDDTLSQVNSLLVDCGATSHVFTDASKFANFDKQFDLQKHFIELADGTKANNVAVERGSVKLTMNSSDGKCVNAELENALYIPSYPQDIFSVQAATEKGSTVVDQNQQN